VGLTTTAIFWRFQWLLLRNLQTITWAAIWRQNPFSANILLQHRCVRLLEPTAQISMTIDPYYQRQKCRPMNLVSENIRFMRIFAGGPLGAGVKRHWGLSTTAIFGYLAGYVLENVRDTASNIIWRYMRPIVDRQMNAKWMTLNDLEWLLHDKMRFWPALLESERLMMMMMMVICSVPFTYSADKNNGAL